MINKRYDTTFLGSNSIYLPEVNTRDTFLLNNCILDFTHFSILFSKERKMPICTAVNIDGEKKIDIPRSSDYWKFYKEALNDNEQTGPSFYGITDQQFHKGHIVRRLDPCWGTEEDAAAAEEETFYYVNACPQHRRFNPAIWLELERSILEKGAVAFDKKISVFSGPVLHKDDLPYIHQVNDEYVFIPFMFWKIVVWKKDNGKVYAIGFVQSQKSLIYPHLDTSYQTERVKSDFDRYIENLKFKDDVVYQTDIHNIEKITGLQFNFANVIKPKVGVEMKEIKANYETKPAAKYKSENAEPFDVEGIIFE